MINPITVGEKMRNKRFEVGLLQKDVAKIIGVTEDTITNWENNRTKPYRRFEKSIIKFLEITFKNR